MATTDNAPPVTRELLAWLEGVFPDRVPTGYKTPEEGMFMLLQANGQQTVIRKLRQVHHQQHADALTGISR